MRGGANYTTNLAWVVKRSVKGRRLKVVATVLLGQLSVGAQAAAFYALYWYAEQTQADAIVSLNPLGIELRAREDLSLLWAVAIASAVCFIGSAGFLYRSQDTAVDIGEQDVARRLTEVVRIAKRLPDPRAPEASRILLEDGLAKVTRGCRYSGSTVVTLLGAVTPLIGGVGAGAVLMVIDPILTSVLAIAAALWSVLLYPFMRRQLKINDRMIQGKRDFALESRALPRGLSRHRRPRTAAQRR